LMLSPSICLDEVFKKYFIFVVVKFKNWGSLAELLCFWCCPDKLQSWASLTEWFRLNIGEVSHNRSFSARYMDDIGIDGGRDRDREGGRDWDWNGIASLQSDSWIDR
jgi:hypothetical protein